MKSISEYMDIDKIIRRLQDVDKLKMLLLDDNQQKVFEILPKPGISARKSLKNHLTGLTFESVSSSPQLPRQNEKKIIFDEWGQNQQENASIVGTIV